MRLADGPAARLTLRHAAPEDHGAEAADDPAAARHERPRRAGKVDPEGRVERPLAGTDPRQRERDGGEATFYS